MIILDLIEGKEEKGGKTMRKLDRQWNHCLVLSSLSFPMMLKMHLKSNNILDKGKSSNNHPTKKKNEHAQHEDQDHDYANYLEIRKLWIHFDYV